MDMNAKPVQMTRVMPAIDGFAISPKENRNPKIPKNMDHPQPCVPPLLSSMAYPIAATALKSIKNPTKRGRIVIEISGRTNKRNPMATFTIPETKIQPQLLILLRLAKEALSSKNPVMRKDQLKMRLSDK